MTQKMDRALKFVDEVKTFLTHKLPEKSRRDFATKTRPIPERVPRRTRVALPRYSGPVRQVDPLGDAPGAAADSG